MILDVVVAVIAVVELVAAARPLPDVVDFFDPSTAIGCCPLILIFPFIRIAVVAPLLLAVGLLEVEAVVVAAAADRDEDSVALIIKLNQHYQILIRIHLMR